MLLGSILLGKKDKRQDEPFAQQYALVIAFGYYEQEHDVIYSSYRVIAQDGKIIGNYRRVSSGWRIANASCDYREGKDFLCFNINNKKFAVLLCSCFWEDDLLTQISTLDPIVGALCFSAR